MRNFILQKQMWMLCLALLWIPTWGAEPLPLSTHYWQDAGFVKSFNGSYRIEARIEPTVSTDERGVLLEIQNLMADGKRTDAIAKLKGNQLTNSSAALRFNLGNLYFEDGKIKESIAEYEKAIEAYPSFRRAHRNLGIAQLREGEIDEALKHLIRAVQLGDSEGTSYGLLGYCRLQRGEWASALQAYRMAQVSEPDEVEWKAGVAQCLPHLGAMDEAVILLEEVIRARPEEASYAQLLANLLMELERNTDAVKVLEMSRRMGGMDGNGLLLLAELNLREGWTAEALARAKEAFTFPENDAEKEATKLPSIDRISALLKTANQRKEWDLGYALLAAAREKKMDLSDRPVRLSEAKLNIASEKNIEKGVESLRKLTAEDPSDGSALLELGKYEISQGKSEEGVVLLERAALDEGVAADAWVEITRLRVKEERYGVALNAIDKALAVQPGGSLAEYRQELAKLVEAAE